MNKKKNKVLGLKTKIRNWGFIILKEFGVKILGVFMEIEDLLK